MCVCSSKCKNNVAIGTMKFGGAKRGATRCHEAELALTALSILFKVTCITILLSCHSYCTEKSKRVPNRASPSVQDFFQAYSLAPDNYIVDNSPTSSPGGLIRPSAAHNYMAQASPVQSSASVTDLTSTTYITSTFPVWAHILRTAGDSVD